jgi:NAD(P)H dehydrogenase (quinone)
MSPPRGEKRARAGAPSGGDSTSMRVLIVFAHPSERSFIHAINDEIGEILRVHGHEVDLLDLYDEHFDPVMSRHMYKHYLDPHENRLEVTSYADRLLAAEALVLIYPVWHDGLPAILKGYIDKVFLRGVAFDIDEQGVFWPRLGNIRRLAAIATYGASRHRTAHVGDLPRRFVHRNLGALIAPGSPIEYFADYAMDIATPPQRDRFLKRVARAFRKW